MVYEYTPFAPRLKAVLPAITRLLQMLRVWGFEKVGSSGVQPEREKSRRQQPILARKLVS
jgi:hypothetical protein